ncbi:hypothetical protein B0O99DRAFT_601987 [Bisporella sp. PMI_857]|nr:hypothetical protein B0O99DRAFT_601987 [Bisporella sp. PMI_857]
MDAQNLLPISASRKRHLSPAEWEKLRPVIEDLYIRRRLRFKDVVIILREEHGVQLSKRQFDYKIEQWKLRKNASTSDRRKILDGLVPNEPVPEQIGTFKLSEGKKKRWEREMRRDHTNASETASFQFQTRTDYSLTDGGSDAQPMEVEHNCLSVWESADIVNPTRLTALLQLFDDLRIHEDNEPLSDPWLSQETTGARHMIDEYGEVHQHEQVICTNDTTFRNQTFFSTSRRSAVQSSRKQQGIQVNSFTGAHIFNLWLSPSRGVSPFPTKTSHKASSVFSGYAKLSLRPIRDEISEVQGLIAALGKLEVPDYAALIHQKDKLAHLYYSDCQYNKAEMMWLDTLLLQMEKIGATHRETVRTYLIYAYSQVQQGKSIEAAKALNSSSREIIEEFGLDSDIGIASLWSIGLLQYQSYNFREAEASYRQALQISLTRNGMEDTTTTYIMNCLVMVMKGGQKPLSSHHLACIGDLARQVLYLDTKLNSRQVGDDFYRLARILGDDEQYEMAIAVLEEALRAYQIIYRPDHSEVHKVIHDLAFFHSMNGQYKRSIELLRLLLFEKWLQRDFNNMLNIVKNLWMGLLDIQSFIHYETINRLAVFLSIHVFGINSSKTWEALHNLEVTLVHSDRLEEATTRAEELYLHYHRQDGTGLESANTRKWMDILNRLYSKQNIFQEKEAFEQRLEWIRKTINGTRILVENGIENPEDLLSEIERLVKEVQQWVDEDEDTATEGSETEDSTT